jgi:hypothetical protein
LAAIFEIAELAGIVWLKFDSEGRNRRPADFRNAGTGIMSRHNIRLMHAGRPVLVVAGYDRPLRELFLQVFRCQESVSLVRTRSSTTVSMSQPSTGRSSAR